MTGRPRTLDQDSGKRLRLPAEIFGPRPSCLRGWPRTHEDWRCFAYLWFGNVVDAGKWCGCSDSAICVALKRQGFESQGYKRQGVSVLSYRIHKTGPPRKMRIYGGYDPEVVRQMLDRYMSGEGSKPLCEEFGVPVSTFEKWCAKLRISKSRWRASMDRITRDHGIHFRELDAYVLKLHNAGWNQTMIAEALRARGLHNTSGTAAVRNSYDQQGLRPIPRQVAMNVRRWGGLEAYENRIRTICLCRFFGCSVRTIAENMPVSYGQAWRWLKEHYETMRPAFVGEYGDPADGEMHVPAWIAVMLREQEGDKEAIGHVILDRYPSKVAADTSPVMQPLKLARRPVAA